ncbi:membrane protein [Vibrio sp. JCM 19052]|nr:membrane protein [Vibrio sp. JCM 19052]
MSDNLSIDNATQRRILRFTIGVGLAVFLAAWINWQLAFVAPVFTAKFLVDKPNLHRETIYELLLALIATMGLGLLLSGGITQYPIVLLIAVGLMMAWGYYLFTDPKWNLFATILLIAVLMLPFMAINNPAISIVLASGLAISGAVSVAIFALVHIYLPEPDSEFAGYAAPPIGKEQRWHASFRAMLISFPVVCFFFIFQISEALLTMMFVALLSLMITSEKSVKLSAFLIISNGIGGILAILAFSILAIVPSIFFYTAFITLLAVVIGKKIYTVPEKAPIFATAFSTLLVLIGSTLMSSGDIDSNTFIRIFQLVLVGTYMILASLFLETRQWKFLQT